MIFEAGAGIFFREGVEGGRAVFSRSEERVFLDGVVDLRLGIWMKEGVVGNLLV